MITNKTRACFLALLCFTLSACTRQNMNYLENRKTSVIFGTPYPLAEYPNMIEAVHPLDRISFQEYDESIKLEDYFAGRGIMIILSADYFGYEKEYFDKKYLEIRDYLSENAKLVVDGIAIKNNRGYGPVYPLVLDDQDRPQIIIGWTPRLKPGLHTAAFRFRAEDGTITEYTWQFLIEE